MARGKQQQEKKDGQHRKETKEERRARLQAEKEAREQCLKILPYIALVIVAFLIAFALYVRSVPPSEPKPHIPLTTATDSNQNMKVIIGEDGSATMVPLDNPNEVKDEGETMEL